VNCRRSLSASDGGTCPVHARWLNRVEIYFSIGQGKVLAPSAVADLDAVAERLHWAQR
jgi:hypothetical protein